MTENAKTRAPASQSGQPRPGVDGRRMRAERSRQKIVTALLELVRDGDVQPSAETVAERAQVGLRSVFRHFKDMDGLYREMSDLITLELAPIYQTPFISDNWAEQVMELVERRAKVFEAIMPIKVAADIQRHTSPFLVENRRMLNDTMRTRLVDTLPTAIRRKRTVVDALDLVMSFEAWRRLREDQGLTPAQAKRTVETTVRTLLDAVS